MNNMPTTEERIWAALSHLSALAFGMGLPLPVIGWSDQRRRSNYASFQCLQALGYQSLGFTIWVLSYLLLILVVLAAMLAVLGFAGENIGAGVFRPWAILFLIVVFGFFVLYFLLPIIATVACAFGWDFRYPIMGDRLARYLAYDPTQTSDGQAWLNEDKEFRWVAAMGHFSVLIIGWGMLAPLTTWVLYGKRNYFLKFQSIQTIVYQASTTLLYFMVLILYGIGLFSLMVATAFTGHTAPVSPIEMLGILLFGVFLLVALVIALLVPLLHILGQWAGYCVLKGVDYRYPLVGALVDQWISKQRSSEVKENSG